MEQQDSQAIEITKLYNKFVKENSKSATYENRTEKLGSLSKKGRSVQTLIYLLAKSLKTCEQASDRISSITLVSTTLFQLNSEKVFLQLNTILCDYQQKIATSITGEATYQKTEDYMRANVQLPFLRFLKKVLRWKMQQTTTEDQYHIDQGFSYLNRVKSAFQLRIIFHNFSCYYPQHYQAREMFRTTLLLISKWWNQICDIGKAIIKESISTGTVIDEDYLFLQEADNTQDLLVDFVTVGNFAKKIQKNFKLKQINFLPFALQELYNPSKIKMSKKIKKQRVLDSKNLKETYEDQILMPCSSEESKDSSKHSKKDILELILTLSSLVQGEQ